MMDQIQEWLTKRSLPPGVLAVGFRQPDGGVSGQSLDPKCPQAGVEELFNQYSALDIKTGEDEPAARWCTWVFERGLVRFVERPDRWMMGIIVAPESSAQSVLDTLAREFLALAPDAA